ncbi:MAG: hypothetical protein Kow001_14420 [Acidobacteriota bacterium]
MDLDPVNRGADSKHSPPVYRLLLFVAGGEPNSLKALAAMERLRKAIPEQNCRIEVVDVLQDYSAALAHRIMVVPALLIESPLPRRLIVGSLADDDEVLAALGVSRKGDAQ